MLYIIYHISKNIIFIHISKPSKNIKDKYKGVLLGLAVGDVLGTPFEFWNADKVVKYLTEHELEVLNFEIFKLI